MYHKRTLVVLGGLQVMSENGKMLDKPQSRVDILTILLNCPQWHSLERVTTPGQGR